MLAFILSMANAYKLIYHAINLNDVKHYECCHKQ